MPAVPTEQGLEQANAEFRPIRLLLVEPDRVVREALREAFEMEGFRVASAAELAEVESSLNPRSFDCLLVDVDSETSARWADVRILRERFQASMGVMSVQSCLLARAERSGADRFWLKPLEPGEVAEWMRGELFCPHPG